MHLLYKYCFFAIKILWCTDGIPRQLADEQAEHKEENVNLIKNNIIIKCYLYDNRTFSPNRKLLKLQLLQNSKSIYNLESSLKDIRANC